MLLQRMPLYAFAYTRKIVPLHARPPARNRCSRTYPLTGVGLHRADDAHELKSTIILHETRSSRGFSCSHRAVSQAADFRSFHVLGSPLKQNFKRRNMGDQSLAVGISQVARKQTRS